MSEVEIKSSVDNGNLLCLSKEELIDRVKRLEIHVTQLRNIIAKSKSRETKKPLQRSFDFSRYNVRHVALKIAYLGCDYQGFAAQEDTNKTIEAALFEALVKTRLIESRETSSYHRCGRTDKGVSAFSQVVSLDLRTNLLEGKGVKGRENGTANERPGDKTLEIRYVHILNKVLPQDIRVLAWCPVDPEFSARFSCKRRTYKYFFPRGNLDLNRMADGAKKLIGDNDYRNLCKMDVANGVVNFRRTVLSVDLKQCQFKRRISETQIKSPKEVTSCQSQNNQVSESVDSDKQSGAEAGGSIECLGGCSNSYDMFELTVVGNAFLWHQIRCIVAVLLLIGEGKESPEIIDELLDVEKNPQKPQYTMASELPLILFNCEFDEIQWQYDADNKEETIEQLQEMWMRQTVKSTMLRAMLEELTKDLHANEQVLCQTDGLVPGNRCQRYKPLLDRQRCESLESRVKHYAKRRKLEMNKEGNFNKS